MKDALDHPRQSLNKIGFIAAIQLIKTDIKQLLSFRFFCNLVLLGISLRLIFFFLLLPRTASTFGPDEGTYARLAEFVSQGLAVQEFPEYGPFLYNQSKSLIWPSSLLIRLGVEAIDSVRIVSALYGTLVPAVVLLCFFAVIGNNSSILNSKSRIWKVSGRLLLIILIFLPSNFLWASLGLRESASQFWIMLQMYFLIRFCQLAKEGMWVFGLLFVFATMFSFASRPQSALLLSFLIVLFGLHSLIKKRVISILLLSIISVIVGDLFSSTPAVKFSMQWKVYEIEESKSEVGPVTIKRDSEILNGDLVLECRINNQVVSRKDNSYICIEERVILKDSLLPPPSFLSSTPNLPSPESKRNANRVGAASALAPSECSENYTDLVPKLICNISEIPYRITAFLVRPLIVIDGGSTFLLMAGLENIIWLMLILISLWISIKSVIRKQFSFFTSFIAAYLILFSVTASLYEGNMGTAFRHKSTILGFLFLLVSLQASKKRVL